MIKAILKTVMVAAAICLAGILITSCDTAEPAKPDPPEEQTDNTVYDYNTLGPPLFVSTDYIELGKISRISKFRSAFGHSYSDHFEDCRSMKHYYKPDNAIDWSRVKIFAPIDGTLSRIDNDNDGAQFHINSDQYPALTIILFHVNLSRTWQVGERVSEGNQLGTHIGPNTMSDIAVSVNTPDGWKLISYFSIMTDTLFQSYQSRGLNRREHIIISETVRDGDPLTCDGETFLTTGSLESWFDLDD